MSIENENVVDVIAKYFAGEASAEEAMLIDDWIADPINKEEYERLFKLWNKLPGASVSVHPSIDEGWLQLQSSLHSKRGKVRTISFYRYAAAACIIGIIISVALWYFYGNKSKIDEPYSITKNTINQIKPDTIPDGSTITLNKNSSVSYSSKFNKTDRQLSLKGECYFDVAHDKAHPFIITVDNLKILVVGTSFNIRKLLSGDIEVQVQSGVVKMYTAEKNLLIYRGHTGIYNKTNQTLILKDGIDINSISYATKTFSFNDLSLKDVCQYLEKAYNVSIQMDANKFSRCRLTAEFQNKPLGYILDVINATLNTTYTQQGNTVYIKGSGCE